MRRHCHGRGRCSHIELSRGWKAPLKIRKNTKNQTIFLGIFSKRSRRTLWASGSHAIVPWKHETQRLETLWKIPLPQKKLLEFRFPNYSWKQLQFNCRTKFNWSTDCQIFFGILQRFLRIEQLEKFSLRVSWEYDGHCLCFFARFVWAYAQALQDGTTYPGLLLRPLFKCSSGRQERLARPSNTSSA